MPRLPRAGWLAVGAILAALLTASDRLDIPAWTALATGAGAAVGALGAALARRAGTTALLLAFATVGLRAGVASWLALSAAATPPLEPGSGSWPGLVTDVSSPSGMEQRAFVQLEASPDADWLVYAWLPRHPALVPGDRIEVEASGIGEFAWEIAPPDTL